ncbi:nitrilase-related carbon-nitrogen hydrolase [Saccharicrinis fermentans]|uniref:(R)-stereoselective amidase n=1 Tax=Saccharicrinis fermentans DSM 9555 = JCM 21142 TaxID=869213 RepID=W7YHR1_9BACT|nr:nitrilase-related carbon-nitrogen hydrolase [Saccharicrinis fermentans]GAF02084.1 (R)-stereoselective amidase [Saccharicrinis fermentans DSM 9555 = JCM 21142]
MKLLAVSSYSEVGDVRRNVLDTIQWIEKAQANGVDFVLFPELNLSGYTKDREVIDEVLAQKEAIFQDLKNISKQVSLAFAIGFPEKEGTFYYISHFLFSDGAVVGVHRKTHLGPTEKECYSEGNEMNVYAVGQIKIGFQLCYETHFPEISSIQSRKGAHVLAMPFASPRENAVDKLARFKRFLPARAYDNSCFVMACNLGMSMKGESGGVRLALIINPKGELIGQETDGSSMVTISLEEIERIHQTKMGHFNHWKRTDLLRSYYE